MATKEALVATATDGEDRISALPDDILCHILSFLPTKYSVRTRVLSTRWQHLFYFVPTLDFEYSSATGPSFSLTRCISFLDFVNSIFILYKASRMNKFRFKFAYAPHAYGRCLTGLWISDVVNRHVKEIEISILFDVPSTLPRELFSCKTLTKLSLRGHFNVLLPRSVSLPCLRYCDFQNLWFDDNSARSFFRSCPVLECLNLITCMVGVGDKILNIDVPTLKSLTLNESESRDGSDHRFVFNLPNLLSFCYTGPAENGFSGMETFKSLVESDIRYEPESNIRQNGVVVNLVRASCHVQRLHLSCYAIEAFLFSGQSLPIFANLNHLSFDPISSSSSGLLAKLLDNSPKLEFLTFYQESEYLFKNDHISFVLPDHVPACVALHLKEVKFKFTTWMDYDRRLIKYFLKHAKNLEKMIIQSNLAWNEQFDVSSTACQIVFRLVDISRRCENYEAEDDAN